MAKAVVLLSAGLDSSVNLYQAKKDLEVVLTLSFDYGQKAAVKELESAQKLAKSLRLPHKVLDLKWFRDFNRSSLLTQDMIPIGSRVSIDDLQVSQESAKSVWVPNRNGIFLNIAAGFAESLGADFVIPGFNAEEAKTFPDNSEAFMKTLDEAFAFSTGNAVQVKCFTSHLEKTEIVKLGESLNVPWHLIWPCYFAREKWCGQCESCQRSKRAFLKNQVEVDALFMDGSLEA